MTKEKLMRSIQEILEKYDVLVLGKEVVNAPSTGVSYDDSTLMSKFIRESLEEGHTFFLGSAESAVAFKFMTTVIKRELK